MELSENHPMEAKNLIFYGYYIVSRCKSGPNPIWDSVAVFGHPDFCKFQNFKQSKVCFWPFFEVQIFEAKQSKAKQS